MSDAAYRLRRRATLAKEEGRPAAAKRDFEEAIGLLREAGRQRELGQALRVLDEVERGRGDNEAARLSYSEAVALCRGLDEPLRPAHTIRHRGDVHHDAGRPEPAEACYQEALALYRHYERPPPLDLANAIRSLAVLKQEVGEATQARLLWEEAKGLYEAVNVVVGAAESSTWLALLAWRQGDCERARRWLSETIAAAGSRGDPDARRRGREVRAEMEDWAAGGSK